MSKTLRIRGIEDVEHLPDNQHPDIKLQCKGRIRLGAARGEISKDVLLKDMQADDLACVEFANGFKLWTRVDDLYQEHGSSVARGVGTSDDEWSFNLQTLNGNADRGVGKIAVEALEFFGVDLKAVSAEKLSAWFELKQLHEKGIGLYRCTLDAPFKMDKIDGDVAATSKPILVFIHGTASSTQGGFGKLWELGKDEHGKARIQALAALKEKFSDNVYAFEHQTLNISPIDNALLLAKKLPAKAELHLVSHSRGGLVGELLCLGQRDKKTDPLTTDFLKQLFDAKKDNSLGELLELGKRLPEGYPAQLASLKELLKVLDEKQFKISRFVRVACPARGTTLVSGRLDRWLSVVHYLTGANDALDFLLGIVKERTDPRTLPGLEAMMPGSALITLLNHPTLKVAADLSVIAGDIEGDSVWSRLKWQLADWFYSSDHDLVVNTGSMYGGIKRLPGAARFAFDQGAAVNHFNYFTHKTTVAWLVAGLTRLDGTMAGFKPVAAAKQEAPARAAIRRRGDQNIKPRPVAFVLPGTMGSHLHLAGQRIWLDYDDLALGRLAELGISMANVASDSLIDSYYGDFVDYLSHSHDVVDFHYDWRRSVQDSAKMLAAKFEEKLVLCEATRQPLRIVAHSMGGLVVRAMLALYPPLWKRFQALPDSRFMMLGTPNAGSYEAVRWLTGWNPTLSKLSLLDVFHDTAAIVNIVNRYPGLLELLPTQDSGRDFADPSLWESLVKGADKNWPKPLAENLQKLSSTWKLIKSSPIDTERMIYIAGWAKHTVSDFQSQPDRGLFSKDRPPLRFLATRKGDGTVPWALGLLPGVKTWYLPQAGHEALMSYDAAFPSFLDLLQSGTTTRKELLTGEPQISQARSQTDEWMPIEPIDSVPDEQDLSGFVFGAGRPSKALQKPRLPSVAISLYQGNLAYARYPICVGHYLGDTIVSAEAELDKRLDFALTKRLRLGLYPGASNSYQVFIQGAANSKPEGAIVIGLGHVGELSPGLLESGMTHALLDYALKVAEWPDDRFGAEDSTRSARISCLLIGTGFGGMSVRDSIASILNGVQAANQRLVSSQFNDKVLIDEIEFIEIYQDVAISAARELAAVLQDVTLAEQFVWQEQCINEGRGGLRRVLFDDAPNWWQRMEIAFDKKYNELRFIALTDRARAEESLVAGQLLRADQFIAEAISSTTHSRRLTQTLFEMLLPNRLKELAPRQYDVVLIVDEISARYPWELLEDRWNMGHLPPAVAAGMLRQLKTLSFRAQPAHSFQQTAFVVGNPKISGDAFADLPGAAQEAETVARLLSENDYRVNEQPANLDASEIIMGLHADAYRILHLAGHGVHEFVIPTGGVAKTSNDDEQVAVQTISGMVIGNNAFLTPGDVEQMRWVPELVFINCCHLGSMINSIPANPRYNELAANLATQFIKMGVKAVVAAGWAVDDGAADGFAKTFYVAMLRGDAFGKAVVVARKFCYEHFPEANTWGAYQCYGDPDFRLNDHGNSDWKNKPGYHAPVELLTDLENLLSKLRVNAFDQSAQQKWQERIDNCLKLIPEGKCEHWQNRADVTAVLGFIYGELGQLELAITYLDKAIAANDAGLPVTAVQQRANYQVKLAVQHWQSGTLTESGQAALLTAIDTLDIFCRMAATVERLSLLGNAYKCQAWLHSDVEVMLPAIKHMLEKCQQAFRMTVDQAQKIDAYLLKNWMTAEIVMAWHDRKRDKNWQSDLAKYSEQANNETSQSGVYDAELRCKLIAADGLLLQSLVNGGFTSDHSQIIIENYRCVGRRYQALEHIDFLIDMANRAGKKKLGKELTGIRSALS